MVVVAYAAKKFVLEAYVKEAREVVEFVKVWSPVQVFAFPMLRESVPADPPTKAPKVPEYEREEPTVAVVVATDWTPLVPAPYMSWDAESVV